MNLSGEALLALEQFAARIWELSSHENGYAYFSTPVGLQSALPGLEDEKVQEIIDEFESLSGMDQRDLISMTWDASLPGGGSSWSISSVTLESNRRVYLQNDDSSDQPMIISVSTDAWTSKIDREFLQAIFKSNGDKFGIGVFGSSPPDMVWSPVKSHDLS